MERTLSAGPGSRARVGLLLATVLLAALLANLSFSNWTDAQVHDLISAKLPPRAVPAQVVLVDIDERSIADIGPWPWSREVVATLVHNLRQRGARVQLWDVVFAEAAAGDPVLEQTLASAPRPDVVLGQVPVLDPLVQSPPRVGRLVGASDASPLCSEHAPVLGHLGLSESLGSVSMGHIGATPDRDGRLRRLPAVVCVEQARHPQLALAAAALLEPDAPWALSAGSWPFGPHQWLTRGHLSFALDAQGWMRVPYARPHTEWPAISASLLLDPQASLMPLDGAVVLIGATALGLADTVSTPYHPNAPGLSVHAELLGAALDGGWQPLPRAPSMLSAAAAALVALLLVPLMQAHTRGVWLVLSLGLALIAPSLMVLLGRLAGVILPVTAPVLALMSYVFALLLMHVLAERRAAERLAAHLASFLPGDLARDIAQQNPSGESLGKPCQGVLLALRIVGLERWTASVDSLQALALVHALNSVAERAAHRHGGALEHVQGETLLMAWTRADASAVHAAVATARDLLAETSALLQRNESQRHPLGVRAAVEAGAFLIAVAGSRTSRRPLLLGPAVDVAAGMLSLADELASPLLVGARAAALQPDVRLVSLGQFLLPDHPEPAPLYRVAA